MTYDELKATIQAHTGAIHQALAQYAPPVETRYVKAGENLQAALDIGGRIQLDAGATFEAQGYVIRTPVTLIGQGATLVGQRLPALDVLPGTHDVTIGGLQARSQARVVILLGHNDSSQAALEAVPQRIVVEDVSVHGHRGIRALEVNSAATIIRRFTATDCWSIGQESKGVNVLNTPGDVRIEDCALEVGSIGILVGGDTMKLPGLTEPEYIEIRRTRVTRPLSWRTDGVKRVVKTSIEWKGGRHGLVEDCEVEGCWKDGQDGYGATVTPRNGASTTDLVWRNVRMRHVSGGFNLTGHDHATTTPTVTTGIRILGGSCVTHKAGLGGRGTFLQLSSGPIGTIHVQDAVIVPEHSIVYHGERSTIAEFIMHGCHALAGSYGFTFAAVAQASDLGTIALKDIVDNVIGGASANLQKALPGNTYVTAAEFKALPKVQAVLG